MTNKYFLRTFTIFLCFIFLTIGVTLSFGHGKAKHKGRTISGLITGINIDNVTFKTGKGIITIIINEKTKYEMGSNDASKADLMIGMKAKVIGTKLPGNKIVAKEIILEKSKGHNHGKHGKGSHHGH